MEFQNVLGKQMSNLGSKIRIGEGNEMHILGKPINNHHNDIC